MTKRRRFPRIAASLAAASLTLAPNAGLACTPMLTLEIGLERMPAQCRQALSNPRRFLARVKSGKVDRQALYNLVRAFDDGKYGCTENKPFVFKILDSFYSVSERKLAEPWLLRRFASSLPGDADPTKRNEINNLIWLFTESPTYLPFGWTSADARTFVERPEHWPIALARFGKMRARDDAVFASLVDPKSSHFDRQHALKLAEFASKHQKQRKLRVAELYADPQYGPPDFVLAESLLPVSALYPTQSDNLVRQQARAIWEKVIEAYGQSSDPALREKARDLRGRMAPLVLNGWPVVQRSTDGRVWLSPADWPQKVRNPFGVVDNRPYLVNQNDYPTRALREGRTGKVTLAARFGADGKFAAVDVVRSSGSPDLDEAAAKTIARRFRPKLAEMIIDGHQGREVMVPLLVVNWDISDELDEDGEAGITGFSGGILSVVAPAVGSGPIFDCGFAPSFFI